MSSWDLLRDLPLEIKAVEPELLVRPTPRFTRKTTVVHLLGAGEEGLGEDVTYDGALHDRWPELALAGSWTLESFSEHVGALDLFETDPGQHAYLDYRRWAIESAALDLALRQAGTALGAALGREAQPVRFVSSNGSWASWRAVYPELHFKLDPTPEWTDEDFAELSSPRHRRGGRPEGRVPRHVGRQPRRPRALQPRPRGVPAVVDRGSRPDTRDRRAARAASRPGDVGRPDPLVGRRRGAAVRAALPQLQALALRRPAAALRVLRPVRRGGDRALRRRPVRARHRAHADPAARGAVPSGRLERRRARRVQRPGTAVGAARRARSHWSSSPASARASRTSGGATRTAARRGRSGAPPGTPAGSPPRSPPGSRRARTRPASPTGSRTRRSRSPG